GGARGPLAGLLGGVDAVMSATGRVRSLAAVPGVPSSAVVMAGEAGLVAVDARTGNLLTELVGHEGGVLAVAASLDGGAVVSVGEDNTIIKWDTETLSVQSKTPLGTEARAVALSPDSALAAVLTFDDIIVFHLGQGHTEGWSFKASLGQGDGSDNRDDPVQLAFWDSHTLAVALTRGRIQLHDLADAGPFSGNPGSQHSWVGGMPLVTADWVAHQGLVTCMASRPTSPYSSGAPGGSGG
ncbi:unnamed protein product, partial [Discosporangium mesarthrocarpum]